MNPSGELSTSVYFSSILSHVAGVASLETESSSQPPWANFSTASTSGNSTTVGIILGPLAATAMIIAFSVITVGTILGNLLVLSSVCIEKKLQTPPNILIINLAVADLAVAILVMPFAASYDLSGQWVFNQGMCDMFVSFDVMCCTASIVDLCFISVDRYLAITRPFRYARHRTTKLMVGVVVVVWVVSALISFSPVFLFGNEHMENQCLVSQDPIYTIYSTFGAFYIPLFIMVVVYYKIYRAAGELERKELQRRPSMPGLLPRGQPVARSESLSSDSDSVPEHVRGELRRKSSLSRFTEYVRSVSRHSLASVNVGKNRISLKLERKASKTLGIIMGAFVVCWLPFFILAITRVFCGCEIPQALHTTLVWLGYINSMLNPIIYPSFNKDFGPAYRKMLSLCCFKLCPDRMGYREARRTPTPRRFSHTSCTNQNHVAVNRDLHAIAEDSHDESDAVDKFHHNTDAKGEKFVSIHLDTDLLNGNNKKSDNLNEITATAV